MITAFFQNVIDREMDARDMKPLPDKSFDLVIDKGELVMIGAFPSHLLLQTQGPRSMPPTSQVYSTPSSAVKAMSLI